MGPEISQRPSTSSVQQAHPGARERAAGPPSSGGAAAEEHLPAARSGIAQPNPAPCTVAACSWSVPTEPPVLPGIDGPLVRQGSYASSTHHRSDCTWRHKPARCVPPCPPNMDQTASDMPCGTRTQHERPSRRCSHGLSADVLGRKCRSQPSAHVAAQRQEAARLARQPPAGDTPSADESTAAVQRSRSARLAPAERGPRSMQTPASRQRPHRKIAGTAMQASGSSSNTCAAESLRPSSCYALAHAQAQRRRSNRQAARAHPRAVQAAGKQPDWHDTRARSATRTRPTRQGSALPMPAKRAGGSCQTETPATCPLRPLSKIPVLPRAGKAVPRAESAPARPDVSASLEFSDLAEDPEVIAMVQQQLGTSRARRAELHSAQQAAFSLCGGQQRPPAASLRRVPGSTKTGGLQETSQVIGQGQIACQSRDGPRRNGHDRCSEPVPLVCAASTCASSMAHFGRRLWMLSSVVFAQVQPSPGASGMVARRADGPSLAAQSPAMPHVEVGDLTMSQEVRPVECTLLAACVGASPGALNAQALVCLWARHKEMHCTGSAAGSKPRPPRPSVGSPACYQVWCTVQLCDENVPSPQLGRSTSNASQASGPDIDRAQLSAGTTFLELSTASCRSSAAQAWCASPVSQGTGRCHRPDGAWRLCSRAATAKAHSASGVRSATPFGATKTLEPTAGCHCCKSWKGWSGGCGCTRWCRWTAPRRGGARGCAARQPLRPAAGSSHAGHGGADHGVWLASAGHDWPSG